MQGRLAFRFVADQEQMQDAHSEIEAVEHHVAHNHDGDQPEPDKPHDDEAPFSVTHEDTCQSA